MRIALTIATAIFTLLTAAQDCKLATDETDEFTGARKKITAPEKFAHLASKLNTMKLSAAHIDTTYALYITAPAGVQGCVTGESYVYFKFTDSTTIKLMHVGDVECVSPTFLLLASPKDFAGKQVEKLRLGLTTGYVEIEVDRPDVVSRHFECVK
jgi:hypothetical protein